MKSNVEQRRRVDEWMEGGNARHISKGSVWSRRCCGRIEGGGQHARLVTVSTSKVVSLKTLLALRSFSLLFLLVGGVLCLWPASSETNDVGPPLLICLPGWSYNATTLYFLLAVSACIRCWRRGLDSSNSERDMRSHQSSETRAASFANTITVIMFEIAVIYQTTSEVLVWHRLRDEKWAIFSTMALIALLLDLAINRTYFQVKHLGLVLAFGLIWMLVQIIWINGGDNHAPCYQNFDTKDGTSAMSAVVGAIIVVVAVYVYAQLCVQRDRFFSGSSQSPGSQADVVEDDNDGSHGPGTIGSVMQGAVVNPLFAASKRRGSGHSWPSMSSLGSGQMASGSTESGSGGSATVCNKNDGDWLEEESASTNRINSLGTTERGGDRGRVRLEEMSGSNGSGFNGARGRRELDVNRPSIHNSSWLGHGGAAAWARTDGGSQVSSTVRSISKSPQQFLSPF